MPPGTPSACRRPQGPGRTQAHSRDRSVRNWVSWYRPNNHLTSLDPVVQVSRARKVRIGEYLQWYSLPLGVVNHVPKLRRGRQLSHVFDLDDGPTGHDRLRGAEVRYT